MNGIKSSSYMRALWVFFLCIFLSCSNKKDKTISEEQVITLIKEKQNLEYSIFQNWNVSNREGNPNLFIFDYLPQTTDSVWFRYIIRNTESGLQIYGPHDTAFIGLNFYQPIDSTVTLNKILRVKEVFQMTGSQEIRSIENKNGLLIKYPKVTLIFWNTPNDSLTKKYSMYKAFSEDWFYSLN